MSIRNGPEIVYREMDLAHNYHLSEKTMRFNELQRALPNLTQSTLTKQLRIMEDNGLINRRVYNQIPPKVEYSLSDLGAQFSPVLDALQIWGKEYIDYLKRNQTKMPNSK